MSEAYRVSVFIHGGDAELGKAAAVLREAGLPFEAFGGSTDVLRRRQVRVPGSEAEKVESLLKGKGIICHWVEEQI